MPAGTVKELLRNSVLPRVSMNATSSQDPVIPLLGHEISIQGQLRFDITDLVIPNPRSLAADIRDLSPLFPVPVTLVQDDRTVVMCYLDRET